MEAIIFFTVLLGYSAASKQYLWIDPYDVLHITNPLSPSVAMGKMVIRDRWIDYFNDTKFMTLATALGPSYLRVGGTFADFVHFHPESETKVSEAHYKWSNSLCRVQDRNESIFEIHRKKAEIVEFWKSQEIMLGIWRKQDIKLSEQDWIILNSFANCAGWKLIFGLNLQMRDGDRWNCTNAKELIRFTENLYHVNWELGNEPNSYQHKQETELTPEQNAYAFITLKAILGNSTWWKNTKILGPDVNNIEKSRSMTYLESFLDSAGDVLNGVTFHQYDLNGHIASLQDFINVTNLNILAKEIFNVKTVFSRFAANKELWLGETSAAYGGGAEGLSDTFVNGFMWLDKLGITSVLGVDMVVRQTFFGGRYALLDNNFDPRPDYWLTLLYKRLVGNLVLRVTIQTSEAHGNQFRVYCHCTNNMRSGYARGSVVLYFINLHHIHQRVFIGNLTNSTMALSGDLFLLQPEYVGKLDSTSCCLNGVPLRMTSDDKLPFLEPRIVTSEELLKGLLIPAYSFGYLVFPKANFEICK